MKTPKQTLVEMEKGCGKGIKIKPDKFHFNIVNCGLQKVFCHSCQSKISASKQRWKEELEFYQKRMELGYENDLPIKQRIAELNEVLK